MYGAYHSHECGCTAARVADPLIQLEITVWGNNSVEQPASRVAIYPGTFDPITYGHLDVIARARRFTDLLIVAVLRNEHKHPLFSVAERTEMLRESVAGFPNVEVDSFEGLLVEFAVVRQASLIIRGIRAISDYENEWQMAHMNRRLRPDVETIFVMASEAHSFVSSRLVKEVWKLGGNISGLVPPPVLSRLERLGGQFASKGPY
ncbi:MAG: pantetheine-phosphate adenylyltransferase [Acidobacteria bacterium]|nr:pantetheine-phosphate adenylyltransferase [Acidobacteriota bacterium]